MSPFPEQHHGLGCARTAGAIRLIAAACLCVCGFLGEPARAIDDMRAATAVWNDFTASLRRGDYPGAHRLFSPESRIALPYAEFVAEYGPLSAAREMVLVNPESLSTRLDGEWAEIAFGGVAPGTGRRFKVGVSLVKNQGNWGLVAARNERNERLETEARAVLRAAAPWRGRQDAGHFLDELQGANAGSVLFQFYRFEATDASFRAIPLREALRAFHLDGHGEVRVFAESNQAQPWKIQIDADFEPVIPVPPSPPAASRPPASSSSGNDMPEMTEPPLVVPPLGAHPRFDEMPEPTEPPALPPSPLPPQPSIRRAESQLLPDTIE